MIFVTVGTHEQPFDRLVKYVDELKKDNKVEDKIVIQTGFSTYEPQYCNWKKMFAYDEMISNIANARIIITHGGPASFLMPLQIGKIPIVIPRQKQFNEHVNDHQLSFVKAVEVRQKNIICVENIHNLYNVILNYNVITETMQTKFNGNNENFNNKFSSMIDDLF